MHVKKIAVDAAGTSHVKMQFSTRLEWLGEDCASPTVQSVIHSLATQAVNRRGRDNPVPTILSACYRNYSVIQEKS